MINFDESIIHFVNSFAKKSYAFDSIIKFLSNNCLLKGGVVLMIIWILWFKKCEAERRMEIRKIIIATIFATFLGMFIARSLALSLPYRPRPLHNQKLAFKLPHTMKRDVLSGWSSFPSDHGTLFVVLGTGIFLVSSEVGIAVFIYILLIVLFPRIYLGLHYPSDILAGGLLGFITVYVANREGIREKICRKPLIVLRDHTGLFYALFFLISFQITTLFVDTRKILKFSYSLSRMILHHIFS